MTPHADSPHLYGFIVVQLLHFLIQSIQPFLVPVCFLSAWSLVFMLSWSLWAALRDTVSRSRQMHQIPCANCQFFTSNYHLKCPVHPKAALTEDAIHCLDYEPVGTVYRSSPSQTYLQ